MRVVPSIIYASSLQRSDTRHKTAGNSRKQHRQQITGLYSALPDCFFSVIASVGSSNSNLALPSSRLLCGFHDINWNSTSLPFCLSDSQNVAYLHCSHLRLSQRKSGWPQPKLPRIATLLGHRRIAPVGVKVVSIHSKILNRVPLHRLRM